MPGVFFQVFQCYIVRLIGKNHQVLKYFQAKTWFIKSCNLRYAALWCNPAWHHHQPSQFTNCCDPPCHTPQGGCRLFHQDPATVLITTTTLAMIPVWINLQITPNQHPISMPNGQTPPPHCQQCLSTKKQPQWICVDTCSGHGPPVVWSRPRPRPSGWHTLRPSWSHGTPHCITIFELLCQVIWTATADQLDMLLQQRGCHNQYHCCTRCHKLMPQWHNCQQLWPLFCFGRHHQKLFPYHAKFSACTRSPGY